MEQKTTEERLDQLDFQLMLAQERNKLNVENITHLLNRLADVERRLLNQTHIGETRAVRVDGLQEALQQLQRRLHLLEITGTGQNIMLRFKDSTGAVRLEVGVDSTDCPIIKAVGPDGAAVLGVTPGGMPHVAVGRNGRTGFCAMADADGTANLQLKSYRGFRE